MSCFDGRIVDKITDSEQVASEPIIYTDECFLCYSPREDDLQEVTENNTDKFSFGSFARVEKITPDVISVWSEILKKCPDSDLVLKTKAFEDELTKTRYLTEFNKCGVSSNRIKFLKFAETQADHFNCYNKIDLILDTFPYNGTTTTCEALIMGVPVISIWGTAHQSRVGVSLLRHSGFTDWCCNNQNEYISRACSFYGMHKNGFGESKRLISDTFKKSSVCDSGAFAKDFFNIVKNMAVTI
jgi:predicted O-linked N-acetylglucosamine transferase (SPINDLY family)